jgi:hypothetical protein
MAIISSGNFAKMLWPGLNAIYGMSYKDWKTEYDQYFDTFKSDKGWEEDLGVSSFGLAIQKGEGAPVTYDTQMQGFLTRYTHAEYALGFIITRNMVEDDQYGKIGTQRAKALARSMRQTKETVGANVLNRAFNTSYTGGDAKALCVSDHPNVSGGTWSNVPTTAVDISEAALEQSVIDMGKWLDDRGLKIATRPQKLIVPIDLDFEANKILKTEYEVGTANNTVNLVRSRFPSGLVIGHWLTDTDAWFIKTDFGGEGLKYFERRADSFDMDNDFDTDNAKFKAVSRYSFGWTDPRAIYGSQGA